MNDKRIVRIDPSSLAISDCSEKFRLANLEGLTWKTANHKMDYGTAIHKGVATWLGTQDARAALHVVMEHMANSNSVIPASDYRTPGHAMETIREYCETYEHDQFSVLRASNDEVAVELPFMLPYKAYETCDVVLCGVVDSLGTWNKNIKVIKDLKTTAAFAIEDYFASYEMSVQMMVYSYAVKTLGWTDYYPPCIIDGIFLSKSGRKFRRSQLIEFRPDQIEDCMAWVSERIDFLVDRIEGRKAWTRNFTQCPSKFGMCQFSRVCSVQEAYRSGVITSLFNVREYDPCKFNIE